MRLLPVAGVALTLLLLCLRSDGGRSDYLERQPLNEGSNSEAESGDNCVTGLFGTADAGSHAGATAKPRRCEVLVTGSHELPVPGLSVWMRAADNEWECVRTDAEGRAAIDRPPGEWEGRVQVNEATEMSFTMHGTAEHVRLTGTVPLEVVLIDARTGTAVEGGAVGYTDLYVRGDPVSLARTGDASCLPVLPCLPGGLVCCALDISPPEGFVPSGRVEITERLDPRASLLRAIVPLWQEGKLLVHTVGGIGEDATRGLAVHVAYHRSVPLDARVELDSSGEWRIRGIPYHRMHRLDLSFSPDAHSTSSVEGNGTVTWGDDPVAELTVPLVFAPVGTVDLDPGASPYQVGPLRPNLEMASELWQEGGLDVCAIDKSGRPIPGALVAVSTDRRTETARSDALGVAHLRGLSAVEWTIELREPGFIATTTRATVVPERIVSVDLREDRGRSLALLVVDRDGKPARFAQVFVDLGGAEYVRLTDGVQWGTLHTDADGRLCLPGLPDRRVTVSVFLGSTQGNAEIDVGEDRAVIKLVGADEGCAR